jgi:DNA-binding MarR family transcriptional regulator
MAAASQAQAAKEQTDSSAALKESYLTSLRLIERLHRQLLDVIKSELDRTQQNDINSVQALLLFNIGEAELTAGELKTRGHYLGSNVSYNLKKLVEAGYIHHQRSEMDRRSVRVRLTELGKRICRMITSLYERHLTSLAKVGGISSSDLDAQNDSLQRLERFWADQIRFRL